MSAVAPAQIYHAHDLLRDAKDRPRSYELSGIAGNASHTYGYHVDPNELPQSDYSLGLARDRKGANEHPDWASAWDLSFNAADMITVTKRLLDAAQGKDYRMRAVREFCGTLNGLQTYPWDLHNNTSEGIDSWDDSHLWHVHISFYRDAGIPSIADVVKVICGRRMTPVEFAKSGINQIKHVVTHPEFPLSRGNYYGLISGPAISHGGYFHPERGAIRKIQLRLIALGLVPGVKGGVQTADSWADGLYEAPTAAAVKVFQQRNKLPVTGRVDAATWRKMF